MLVLPGLAIELFVVLDRRILLLAAGTGLHHLVSFINSVFGFVINVNLTVTVSVRRVFRLVAIPQPVVEVVTELFQDVHMIANLTRTLALCVRALTRHSPTILWSTSFLV